jgi:hypothetical protein
MSSYIFCFGNSDHNLRDLRELGDKVKFSLEQTMKAQRGSRGIALLFL